MGFNNLHDRDAPRQELARRHYTVLAREHEPEAERQLGRHG
ncbi:MAG TPA: hypothetical protein VF403_07845 [Kofleriaceae bacterium]